MIRWGILGCGDIAKKRVANAIQLDPNSELVAARRRNEQELRSFCDEFNIPVAAASAAELFAREDVDAIYVATPVYLHCQNVMDAAAAGKHVIVEKPMAMNADECDRMIAACEAANVKLSVAYYRRFYPAVTRIKQLIGSGEIGRVLSVSATTGNADSYDDDHWRVVPDQGGGGPLMDIGSHRLDLFLDMFGDVAQINAFCEPRRDERGVETMASLLLQFHSGVHGVLQCYFGSSNVPDHFSVVGEFGRLVVDPLNGGTVRVQTKDGEHLEPLPPHDNLHAPLITDFTNSIQHDSEPTVTCMQGRAVTELIDRAYAQALVSRL